MNRITYSILILIFLGIIFYFLTVEKKQATENNLESVSAKEYVSYKSSEYSPEFTYPKSWGEVTIKEGNKTCPEEDTYRTNDTLNVFDWEFSFLETKLPESESFTRTGVRMHELDPKKLNNCGDDFLLKIASKEILPESLSSVRLSSITNTNGLWGIYNPKTSRLDTEVRMQYTFFSESETSDIIYIIQPYVSFIPNFGSPELREIEQQFAGDIDKYITEGKTAKNIREHFAEFRKMAESLKFSGE